MTKESPQPAAEAKGNFFLNRPVLSTVISVLVTLVGAIAIGVLPVEQYPNLTPPQVAVTANYSGASSETVAQTVASLLEGQINGVDNMIYMNSTSAGTGTMNLNVSFNVGTDPDQATINVNNRAQLANAQLPQEVKRIGVTVEKSSTAILQIVCLTSPGERFDTIYLYNYALLNIVDDLKRINGVGKASLLSGEDYAMRIWLKPDKMAKLKVTHTDIANAIQDQNAEFAAGRIGEEPAVNPSSVTWQITTTGRLTTPKQFEDIILRTEKNGAILRLGDVARVELGSQGYGFKGSLNNTSMVPVAVYLAPGANALQVAEKVRTTMAEISKRFPVGVQYSIPYDTTTFVKISINEVVRTFFEALVLVFLVVYIFLQSFRATLIPCLAVPVSIVGTFAGLYALGFTINTLTLFGLVLAIGIVVDDAIVVLENVERHMSTGLDVRAATAKAMSEVTGPVIAIVLVLCAVFVPIAFLGGMTGRMYQQFAVTIAVSVVISGMVALTFTPALCVLLLKGGQHHEPNFFFRWFNNAFASLTAGYTGIVKALLRKGAVTIAIFCIVIAGLGGLFKTIPSGLVPDEDQGQFMGMIILPDGASVARSQKVGKELTEKLLKHPAVRDVVQFIGYDLVSGACLSNYTTFFAVLKDWKERKSPELSAFSIAQEAMVMGTELSEGVTVAFNPPPISGMSNTGGFEMWIQNRAGVTYTELADVAQKFVAAAQSRPEVVGVNRGISVGSPQIYTEVDRAKCRSLGVNISDVFSTMSTTFGSYYINDFTHSNRTFRVYAQADEEYRTQPGQLKDVYVRNKDGEMVPVVSVLNIKFRNGPQVVQRFNNFQAAQITGSPAPGFSSGQAMAAMEAVAKEALPEGFTVAWSGTSYQEKIASGSTGLVIGLALVMVFLILAAQYESWTLPITVMTAVPFGVLGALVAIWCRGFNNDVYFHVALITLVGLSAKNAILIVEFAVEKVKKEGKDFLTAAVEAAELRFRPIVMTSLAFILGCVPLMISSGAGAASRQDIGTGVVGGMLFATGIAPMFIPFFFRWVMTLSEKLTKGKKAD